MGWVGGVRGGGSTGGWGRVLLFLQLALVDSHQVLQTALSLLVEALLRLLRVVVSARRA